MHKPSLHPLLLPLVKVCCAEILVRLLPRQHHVDDGEDGMPDRKQGTFLPPACGNPFVLGCERGVFCFGGDMGNFDEDLSDAPRFLLTDALHWESGRMIETWSFRWTAALFHAFGKQGTGLEAAQGRTEEAVKRHLRLSCVAQSLLQRAPVVASSVEKFAFAHGQCTLGQRCRVIAREVFHALLQVAQRLFMDGRSCEQVLEVFMPA